MSDGPAGRAHLLLLSSERREAITGTQFGKTRIDDRDDVLAGMRADLVVSAVGEIGFDAGGAEGAKERPG